MKKVLLTGFLVGAIAVIAFHQASQHVLFHLWPGIAAATDLPAGFRPPSPGFNVRPVPPFGVPQVIWLSFWGGLWGILLAAVIRFLRFPDLLAGVLVGIAATVVGFTAVAQYHGQPMWAGGTAVIIARALVLNIAFGWGTAFLMRPFSIGGRG
jgi:hypothetical protein